MSKYFEARDYPLHFFYYYSYNTWAIMQKEGALCIIDDLFWFY